jgi:hypothetical protein
MSDFEREHMGSPSAGYDPAKHRAVVEPEGETLDGLIGAIREREFGGTGLFRWLPLLESLREGAMRAERAEAALKSLAKTLTDPYGATREGAARQITALLRSSLSPKTQEAET